MSLEYTRVNKYAKLEAEHKELRKQYDALYNIAVAIRNSIAAPLHPAPALPNHVSHQMMKVQQGPAFPTPSPQKAILKKRKSRSSHPNTIVE